MEETDESLQAQLETLVRYICAYGTLPDQREAQHVLGREVVRIALRLADAQKLAPAPLVTAGWAPSSGLIPDGARVTVGRSVYRQES